MLNVNLVPILFIDETSKQLAALKILSEALGKGKETLYYLYEEYKVYIVYTVFYIATLIVFNVYRKVRVLTQFAKDCIQHNH